MVNDCFINYIIFMILDVLEMDVGLVEVSFLYGLFGVKGIGEMLLDGVVFVVLVVVEYVVGHLVPNVILFMFECLFDVLEEFL